jgi:hypothetical protein
MDFYACICGSGVLELSKMNWGSEVEAPKAPRYRVAEGDEGWGLGRGLCPLPSRLGGLGERRELPQRGPGQSPGSFSLFTIFLLISSLNH